jgi:hypothetical protein
MRASAVGLLFAGLLVSACGYQRAQVAKDAPNLMMGMSKDQVLACMGQPANKSTAAGAEVWSYNSTDGSVEPMETGGEQNLASRMRAPSPNLCTVNITLVSGRVSKLSYAGPDGEAMPANQRCAFALQNCIQ